MKKSLMVCILVGLLVFSVAVGSAWSFSDWWNGGVTGKAIDSNCIDKDGGKKYQTYGNLSYLGESYLDECVTGISDSHLREWYCGETVRSKMGAQGPVYYELFDCSTLGSNWICEGGKCALSDMTPPVITYSCTPILVNQGETITCSCSAVDDIDPNPLVSYTAYPDTSVIGSFITTCVVSDSSGNSDVETINYTVTNSSNQTTCADSDGGLNYYTKGTLTDVSGSYNDTCNSSTILKEWYCNGNSRWNIYYDCSSEGKVCSNGQCNAVRCTDTDYGINYETNGTVTGLLDGQLCNGALCVRKDHCGGVNSELLSEFYCDGSEIKSIYNYSCPNGCLYGKCLEGSNITTCYNNSDCPSVLGERYCSGNNSCGSVESYNCIGGECVSVGGGAGCSSCSLGCNNETGLCIGSNATSSGGEVGCESGCVTEDGCIGYGIRSRGLYCEINREMKNQKSPNEICDNNFECKSNSCSDGKCVDVGAFRSGVIKLLCKIINPISTEEYENCKSEYLG